MATDIDPGVDEFCDRVQDALRDGFGEPHYAKLLLAAMDQIKVNPVLLPVMMLQVVILDRVQSLEEERADRLERRIAEASKLADITPEKQTWMRQQMDRLKQEYLEKFEKPVAS